MLRVAAAGCIMSAEILLILFLVASADAASASSPTNHPAAAELSRWNNKASKNLFTLAKPAKVLATSIGKTISVIQNHCRRNGFEKRRCSEKLALHVWDVAMRVLMLIPSPHAIGISLAMHVITGVADAVRTQPSAAPVVEENLRPSVLRAAMKDELLGSISRQALLDEFERREETSRPLF